MAKCSHERQLLCIYALEQYLKECREILQCYYSKKRLYQNALSNAHDCLISKVVDWYAETIYHLFQ